jgi:lipopolysaccharide biosynthesis glycosyltransferase
MSISVEGITQDWQTTGENNSIVVVCAADNNYAMPLTVAALSALENLSRDYKMQLFLIDGEISNSNKQKIRQSLDSNRCQIKFIPRPDRYLSEVQDVLKSLRSKTPNEQQHIAVSLAPYYRLFLAKLLPPEIERAIYLDCDLVVKDDLKELWVQDFKDNYVLAVQDMWVPYVSSVAGVPYDKLGISANSKYFNSGVLVINIKKWRSDDITTKAIEYLKTYQQDIRAHDQDVLNGLFAGHWGEIEPRWNLTPAIIDLFPSWQESPFSEEVYRRLIDNPSIIHFATSRKPWNSRHTLFKEAFFEYVDRTAWSGWRLTVWRRLKISMSREYKKLLSRFE